MDEVFEIEMEGKLTKVQSFDIGGQRLFKVFIDTKPPIIILRANHNEGHKFWTSMPEGRQREAEKIGPFIEQYYRSKK